MTAGEVLERIRKNYPGQWRDGGYRDTFKAGGPETEVKGIATTFMCTLDLLQRAHAAGLNMVIPHEDTFFNDRDDITGLENDPVYKIKTEFCARNNMVVWRNHDHTHASQPDPIWTGLTRVMGWGDHAGSVGVRTFTIPTTTLGELAADLQKRAGSRALRVVGDPKMKVTTISVGLGYNIPRLSGDVDVTIGGENPETGGALDATEYAFDAAALGVAKGEIILGHAISEEWGMEDFAGQLRSYISEIPIQFMRSGEPYWVPKGVAGYR